MSENIGNQGDRDVQYVKCPKCEYEQNPSTATKCYSCGAKLKPDKPHKIRNYLFIALLLIGFFGGGLFVFLRNPTLKNGGNGNSNVVPTDVTIKVLADTFSGYSTLRNKDFQGTLKESNIRLQYADEFIQSQRAEALNQGKADLILTTLDQFLTYKPQGKIIALIDRTVGADAVVLNSSQYPQLNSLIELNKLVTQKKAQGERLKIVFAEDTPSEFLAMVLDSLFDDFDLIDFEVVRVTDASEAWQQMQTANSNIALAVLWEPFVTQAKKQGNTVVLSSKDVPKTIVDVAVASERILTSNPQAVQDFVNSYYRRIDSSIQDKTLLPRQIAIDGNLTEAEATNVVEGIKFFTSLESKEWMESETLKETIEEISSILELSGRIKEEPPNPQELFTVELTNSSAKRTAELIKKIAKNNPRLASKLPAELIKIIAKDNQELASLLPDSSEETTQTPVTDAQAEEAPDVGYLKVRGEVKFFTGSATLTAQGKQTLDRLAKDVKRFNANTIAVKVQGHTSRTGTADLNQKLSQNRAKVVVNYLKGKELPHKFFPEGLGYSQPLPGVDPTSPLNQRTVIRLIRIGS